MNILIARAKKMLEEISEGCYTKNDLFIVKKTANGELYPYQNTYRFFDDFDVEILKFPFFVINKEKKKFKVIGTAYSSNPDTILLQTERGNLFKIEDLRYATKQYYDGGMVGTKSNLAVMYNESVKPSDIKDQLLKNGRVKYYRNSYIDVKKAADSLSKVTAEINTAEITEDSYILTDEKIAMFVRDGLLTEQSANIMLNHLKQVKNKNVE